MNQQNDDGKKNNYLVCINSEEYSQTALRFTCQLVRQNNGTIILLHVIEPADYQTLGMIAEKIRQEKHSESQLLLSELSFMAKEWSGIMPMLMVREGFIEEEIIKVIAEDLSINMLITGTAAEHSKKSKIIPPLVAALGSKLHIPMLIVPGNMIGI